MTGCSNLLAARYQTRFGACCRRSLYEKLVRVDAEDCGIKFRYYSLIWLEGSLSRVTRAEWRRLYMKSCKLATKSLMKQIVPTIEFANYGQPLCFSSTHAS